MLTRTRTRKKELNKGPELEGIGKAVAVVGYVRLY
jgi:hypothetical protein